MTTTTEFITKRDYKLNYILDDEIDAVEEMLDRTGYLCDAVSETADSFIPIYTSDVWDNASKISEYIEEAISEGIAPVHGNSSDIDLIRIFQSGYYVYYQSVIYDNLDEIVFNYVAEKINEYLGTVDNVDSIDIDGVNDAIENAVANIDNNDDYDALDDIANGIIENIDNEEYPS